MIVFGVGLRLPYLRSAFSMELRAFWILPILTALFVYGFARGKWDGRWWIRVMFEEMNGPKEKLTFGTVILVALIGVPPLLAWSSIAYPAFATLVFADRPFARTYTVLEAKSERWYVKFRLKDNRGSVFALQIDDSHVDRHGSSTIVCMTGREWPLGVIVSEVSADTASCDSSRP